MVEIYRERLRDLLAEDPTTIVSTPARRGRKPKSAANTPGRSALGSSQTGGGGGNLQIMHDEALGVSVDNLTTLDVHSFQEMMEVLAVGSRNRHVASTDMNEFSSRSHSIFIVTIQQRSKLGNCRVGTLYLVDLAGSEKVAKSRVSGETLKEAQAINSSLSSLGNVINARVNGAPHIPYRDSKLTRILQDGLGENSCTSLIINVSPSSYNR